MYYNRSGEYDLSMTTPETYNNSCKKNGYAVIINNFNFTSRLANLRGGDKDSNRLMVTFRSLKFDVRVFENRTKDEMMSTMKYCKSISNDIIPSYDSPERSNARFKKQMLFITSAFSPEISRMDIVHIPIKSALILKCISITRCIFIIQIKSFEIKGNNNFTPFESQNKHEDTIHDKNTLGV